MPPPPPPSNVNSTIRPSAAGSSYILSVSAVEYISPIPDADQVNDIRVLCIRRSRIVPTSLATPIPCLQVHPLCQVGSLHQVSPRIQLHSRGRPLLLRNLSLCPITSSRPVPTRPKRRQHRREERPQLEGEDGVGGRRRPEVEDLVRQKGLKERKPAGVEAGRGVITIDGINDENPMV